MMKRPRRRQKIDHTITDLLFQVSFHFVTQIREIMEAEKIDRSTLAKRLGVSKGRVSQLLNDPGNVGLENIVRYTARLDRKVAVVVYDDGDDRNEKGLILPQVFLGTWKKAGRPHNFFELNDNRATRSVVLFNAQTVPADTDHVHELPVMGFARPNKTAANTGSVPQRFVFNNDPSSIGVTTPLRTGTDG